MPLDLQLYFALALFFIGFLGIILRRSWMHILLFSLICLSAVMMVFQIAAQFHGSNLKILAAVEQNSLFFLLIFSIVFLVSLAVSIMIYRRRGSLRIDELHELEG